MDVMLTQRSQNFPSLFRLTRTRSRAALATVLIVIACNTTILILTTTDSIDPVGPTENGAIPGIFHHVKPDTGAVRGKLSTQSEGPSYPVLNCDVHGGPSLELAQEMVYWEDIAGDSDFRSPFWSGNDSDSMDDAYRDIPRYLTVEPDFAGFNNYRMSMEVYIVLAAVTGRVLVVPPTRAVSHFDQEAVYAFTDFFDLESIAEKFNRTTFSVISYEDYLKQEFLKDGHFKEPLAQEVGKPVFPQHNRTDWNGYPKMKAVKKIDTWLRKYTTSPEWGSECCLLFIPESGASSSNNYTVEQYNAVLTNRTHRFLEVALRRSVAERENQRGDPTPVDASAGKRLEEVIGRRDCLYLYDGSMQFRKYLHMRSEATKKGRIIAHFYNYFFFEDWRVALWTKRFVRDNLRYNDEVQCAAARIVAQLRTLAKSNPINHNSDGVFYSMHIRRTDLLRLYNKTVPGLAIDAESIYRLVRFLVPKNQTIYIATDEEDHAFFDVFREGGYSIYFLGDFLPQDPSHDYYFGGLNKDFRGLVEQLVASRAEIFVGCYYSTFTGYINRLRGYHTEKKRVKGLKDGAINSFYYAPKSKMKIHRQYTLIQNNVWGQEYPVGWRDIDRGYLP